jgi:hypothetical protein
MTEGEIYSVVSQVDVTPVQVLRARPFDYADADPAALARWTDLPDTVPERVRDLAVELALDAAAQTPYAIAERIQAHIGATISYSLQADPTPQDADPADHILFEQQVGWCEPIATAMVVLLRQLGIPARFVTGFQPGTRQILSGQYTVRASDAHAWVELFVPGVGWVPMDPTGATTPTLDPEGEGPQILLLQAAQWLLARLPRDPVIWAVAILACLAVAAAAVTGQRWRRRVVLRRAGPWAQLLDRLRQEGVTPPTSDTPAEVVARARRLLPHVDPAVLHQVQAYEEARRYSDEQPDRQAAEDAVARL